MQDNAIKVMVVDDSAVVRQSLTALLNAAPDINVMGSAMDPIFAEEKMKDNWPDVIVLDLEMPRMDGLTFLKKIMKEHPTPVIICSTHTLKGSESSILALSAGAVAIINKPTIGLKDFFQNSSDSLIQSVRTAAQVNTKNIQHLSQVNNRHEETTHLKLKPKFNADVMLSAGTASSLVHTTEKVIAIGTSTGGTLALEYLLPTLPKTTPGIAVVQHMPEKFTLSFAKRLNEICQMNVREAKNGDALLAGVVLLAPGGKHMMVHHSDNKYFVEVRNGPLVNRHRPSVDVLFRSVAKSAGQNALGIIMTGMGDDGARGMREMFDASAQTIAQDEASSIIYGMPKEAIKHGGVSKSLPLDKISGAILSSFNTNMLLQK